MEVKIARTAGFCWGVRRTVDKVMESEKVTPEEMAQRTVEFEGRKAGSRTLGTMESNQVLRDHALTPS